MKTKQIWSRMLVMLLSLCMLVTAAGCGKDAAESDVSVLYGDAVDRADDDDDAASGAVGTDSTGQQTASTASGGTKSGTQQTTTKTSSGGKTTATTNSGSGQQATIGVGQGHEIDEAAKGDFLKSIPKRLSGTTVKILVWWQPGTAEVAKMKKFTEATGIKIQWVSSGGGGEYLQKLSAMKIQGSSPDLACIRGADFPNVIMQDYFEPLSYGKLDYSDTKIYDVTTMNQYKWNHQLYGALIKGSSMAIMNVLYYNVEMFNKVGMTTPRKLWEQGKCNWDTFRELCVEAKTKMKTTAALTGEYHGHVMIPTANTSYTKISNGKLVNNLSDPKLLSAWTYINDLKDTYKVLDNGINRDGWIAQKCPMFMDGNYYLQKGDYFDKNVKFKYDYVPLPSPAGQPLTVSASLQMWGFPKGSKNAEAAAYALRYWWANEYDEKGQDRWTDQKAAEFNNWLWEQPKCFENSGIVSYDGSYDETKMFFELSGAGSANVRSVLDRWSGVINSNIKALEREFGK